MGPDRKESVVVIEGKVPKFADEFKEGLFKDPSDCTGNTNIGNGF